MQLDRISYQYPDDTTAAYDLHPRLTVIDVHPSHRSALAEHLVSALSTGSPGVHVEFTRADGSAYVAFRPYGGVHRVIALDGSNTDVSDAYRTADGSSVDVLAPLRLDEERSRTALLAAGADLTTVDPTDGWTSRLLQHDTDRVLGTAGEAVAAEKALREASTTAHSTPQQAAVVSNVYSHQAVATDLEKRHNRIRLATMVIGTACPVAAVVGLNTIGGGPAMGLIVGAVAVAGGCLAYERKLAKAVDEEYDALAAAGARSYTELDSRLDGTALASADERQRLVAAAERYERASGAWQAMAGDIPAPWAVAQGERLRELAAMRAALEPVPVSEHAEASTSAAILAGLMGRSAALRELGSGEALPLFLDDPLAGLAWSDKVPVLEFLNRLSEGQQLVICTDDLEILGWARLEAMAGNAAVIDVNPGRAVAASAGGSVEAGAPQAAPGSEG